MEPKAKLELTFIHSDRANWADVKTFLTAFEAGSPVERFGKRWQVYQIEREALQTVVTLHMLHA